MISVPAGRCARIVVGGTGTGVGKTHVAAAMAAALRAAEAPVVALKPIESGFVDEARSDAALLARAAGRFHVKRPLYAFAEAVSPHLAARRLGVRIDPSAVAEWLAAEETGACVSIVELAGGLFSPLREGLTNLDLVAALSPASAILVAPDRLGVLHDVTAAAGLATARGRGPRCVVLSAPEAPDASTGTNAAELEAIGVCRVAAVFPRAAFDDPISIAAARRVAVATGVPWSRPD